MIREHLPRIASFYENVLSLYFDSVYIPKERIE